MMTKPTFACRLIVSAIAIALAVNSAHSQVQTALAQTTTPLNCSASYQIVQTFNNGATWEMCWEGRSGYGYRLNQVTFTPPGGTRRLILATMHVAQLFVPYDDGGPRYHDLSFGRTLTPLTSAECPGGTLLTNATLCLVRRPRGYAYDSVVDNAQAQGEGFVTYGYFSVGNYYYIIQYTFNDDGSIEPAVGASGSLQRYGGDTSTGWPVGTQVGINHNHVVIWRMDFDLDGPTNDRVEQVDFDGALSDARTMTVTPLTIETKAQTNAATLRFWRVRDLVKTNGDGHSISYEIEPNVTDQYRASEGFTQNDFYVTTYKGNEMLADDGNGLDSFVNGEPVTDVVVWFGVDFHHVPRDEDNVRMPAHFQGFIMRPRDLEAGVNQTGGGNPTPTPMPTPTPTPTSTKVPTSIPTLTPTALATSTSTPVPTSTSVPTLTPTPTPLATSTSTPTATPTAGQTFCSPPQVGALISINFINTGNSAAVIDWASYACQETRYYTLPPGQSYTQWAYANNVWVIRDAQTGALIKSVQPTQNMTVSIP